MFPVTRAMVVQISLLVSCGTIIRKDISTHDLKGVHFAAVNHKPDTRT
jgi:hypothetical protein